MKEVEQKTFRFHYLRNGEKMGEIIIKLLFYNDRNRMVVHDGDIQYEYTHSLQRLQQHI